MNKQPDVTHVDVRYVADLARISLTEEETRRFESELDDIVRYVGQLSELDLEGIEPTAHASGQANVLREDIPTPTLDRARVVANAPAVVDDGLIRVPVVIDEGGH